MSLKMLTRVGIEGVGQQLGVTVVTLQAKILEDCELAVAMIVLLELTPLFIISWNERILCGQCGNDLASACCVFLLRRSPHTVFEHSPGHVGAYANVSLHSFHCIRFIRLSVQQVHRLQKRRPSPLSSSADRNARIPCNSIRIFRVSKTSRAIGCLASRARI